MVEHRRHRAGEHRPLLAKVLVAVHEDRTLLGERGAQTVGAFDSLGEDRTGVDLPLAQDGGGLAVGQAAEQDRRIGIGEVDAIAGAAQGTVQVFQLGRGEVDQAVDRFGVTPQFGLRQRARRTASRRIQLVVDKAAPPGIGNARLANNRRLIMGNRQHALDVIPGLEVRHRDFAPWTLAKFVIALSEVNRACRAGPCVGALRHDLARARPPTPVALITPCRVPPASPSPAGPDWSAWECRARRPCAPHSR